MQEDYPHEIEQRRARLYPILKHAKSKRHKATMNADKLIIDGQRYKYNELDELPKELQPKSFAERSIDDNILFYGHESYFSSFYNREFMLDKKVFNSCEQYYQYKKVLSIGDNNSAELILKSTDVNTQYQIGKKVKPTNDQWSSKKAKEIMEVCTKAKFEQNPDLAAILLSTEDKCLVYCNQYDGFWENGLKLTDGEAHNNLKWKGENTLGVLLLRST